MCITPNRISVDRGTYWEEVPVPCRECWRCRANRVNDFVARALCEASESDWTCTLTLTYATPSPSAKVPLAHKVLYPRHFQDFIRSLRKRGHKIRYIVAGEKGEMKGRSHFHVILFGTYPDDVAKKERPDWPQQRRFHIPEWPHGHVFADWNVNDRSMRYVCKYLLKWQGTESWFSLSKKPTLGAAFFKKKARQTIEAGVLPSGFEYLPPGGQKKRPYMMTGATRRDYIAAVVVGWLERRDLDVTRLSQWVRVSLAKYERNLAFKLAATKINLASFLRTFKDELDRRRPSLGQVLAGRFKDMSGSIVLHGITQEWVENGTASGWKGWTFKDTGTAPAVDDGATAPDYSTDAGDTLAGADESGATFCILGDSGLYPYARHAIGYQTPTTTRGAGSEACAAENADRKDANARRVFTRSNVQKQTARKFVERQKLTALRAVVQIGNENGKTAIQTSLRTA